MGQKLQLIPKIPQFSFICFHNSEYYFTFVLTKNEIVMKFIIMITLFLINSLFLVLGLPINKSSNEVSEDQAIVYTEQNSKTKNETKE